MLIEGVVGTFLTKKGNNVILCVETTNNYLQLNIVESKDGWKYKKLIVKMRCRWRWRWVVWSM
jgi:hypothetical protein